LPQST
jgi:hypothetical protein